MFRDQSASVARRASSQSEAGPSTGPIVGTRQPSPDKDSVARKFFFEHFVTVSHLTYLEGISPDDFLQKPILACGLAALANREKDARGRETARRYYVDAITATNAALQNPRRVKEDNTLMAVALLGLFERLNWEPNCSMQSWKHHVQGAAQVLQLRGRNQIRTATGARLFREVRWSVVLNSLCTETEAPGFIEQWSLAFDYDPVTTSADQLTAMACRAASLKAAFRTGEKSDEELAELTATLEADLLSWSERTLAGQCSPLCQSLPELLRTSLAHYLQMMGSRC